MTKLVHIVPIEGVSIPGIPSIEQDVTTTQWHELQKYVPPAFTAAPADEPTEEPASPEPTEDTV